MAAPTRLGYLRLGQRLTTLSSGERQRLKLATQMGTYGGRVVFEGTPADLVASRSTLTGKHLAAYIGSISRRSRSVDRVRTGMLPISMEQPPFGDSRMATHVVLVHPEIHGNTGNVGRSCLATGATLHLIEPLGFELDDRRVRRAGLDYWKYVDLRVWPSWEAFEEELPALGEPWFFSSEATQRYWDAPLGAPEDVVLIFGRESTGLSGEIRERYRDRLLAVPLLSPRVRSLNLSSCVAVALYEVLRQRCAGEAGTRSP